VSEEQRENKGTLNRHDSMKKKHTHKGSTYSMNAGVVGHHKTSDTVMCLDVRRLLRQGDLDRSGAPRNELGHLSLPDTLQTLVDLRGVDLTLDNVENGDITSLSRRGGNHDVLGLQQTTHHIQHGRLTNRTALAINRQRGVSSHQEMTTRGGDQ